MSEVSLLPYSASAISGNSQIRTSIDQSSIDANLTIYNALNDSVALSDHLDTPINMADYVMEVVDIESESGELIKAVRTVIIDEDGVAYHAMSSQFVASLNRLFALVGEPDTWAEPVTIMVSEGKSGKGRRFYKLTCPKK